MTFLHFPNHFEKFVYLEPSLYQGFIKKKLKWTMAEEGHCNLFWWKLFSTFSDG